MTNVGGRLIYQIIWCDIQKFLNGCEIQYCTWKIFYEKEKSALTGKCVLKTFLYPCTHAHAHTQKHTHTHTHTCWQALVVVIRQMTKAMTTTQCHNLAASPNKASIHLGHACSSFAHSVNLKKMAA